MSTAGNTPNFIAANQILPFRTVKMQDGNSFSVRPFASADTRDAMIGVTDGSVRGFRSSLHAEPGDPVVLQNGEFVQLTCASASVIAAGDLLDSDANGAVYPLTPDVTIGTTRAHFVACENAQYGEVFWAKRIGAYEERSVQGDLVYAGAQTAQTENATPVLLDLNLSFGSRAAALGFAQSFSTFGFQAIVTGSTATSQICGAYLFQGLIRGPGNAGGIAFDNPQVIVASTKTVLGETNAALNCNLVINSSTGWSSFELIGLAATTMRWTFSANVSVMGSTSGTF